MGNLNKTYVKKDKLSEISNNNTNRYVFCDNYYTRHTLSIAIDKITDDWIKLKGTIRTNYIEYLNK